MMVPRAIFYTSKAFSLESRSEYQPQPCFLEDNSMAYRILIADNNEILTSFLVILLHNARYSVVEASNGKEALRYINSSVEFDLLITDLPDMEGLELITVLKKSH